MYLLGSKKQWTHERVDKASKETLNKVYDECKQQKLNETRGVGWYMIKMSSQLALFHDVTAGTIENLF